MSKHIKTFFVFISTFSIAVLTSFSVFEQDVEIEEIATVVPIVGDSIFVEEKVPLDVQINDGGFSQEEIELIALVTLAEAGGESELGKRLVISTILNRVDSPKGPDTVHGVIYQPGQFSVMWNGAVDRVKLNDDIIELVKEEIDSRTNYDVIYFNSIGYTQYGDPLFKVGNHYFSSYKNK